MKFSEAMEALENGARVRNKAWPEDMFIYMVDGNLVDEDGSSSQVHITPKNLSGEWEFASFFREGLYIVDDCVCIKYDGTWYSRSEMKPETKWLQAPILKEEQDTLKMDGKQIEYRTIKYGSYNPERYFVERKSNGYHLVKKTLVMEFKV